MSRQPLSQPCQIVSQRSPAHARLAPADQPVQAVYTEYLPEYFMVKRGEPTTEKEYQIGCLQFKALHPGEGVPPRNGTGFVTVDEDTPEPDYLQIPPEVKPRIVRKVKHPEPSPDQPIYRSILSLVECLDAEHSFKLLKHLAELNDMEIE